MKKILLAFSAAAAIIAPVATTISCGSSSNVGATSKPKFQIESNDTSTLNAKPYTIDSLKAEASALASKDIWSQTPWKAGYLSESVSQGISLIVQLAKEWGYNPITTYEEKHPDVHFITNDMTSMTKEDVLNKMGIDKDSPDFKSSEDTFDVFMSIKPKTEAITQETKNKFFLTGGNQTIDSDDDFNRLNISSIYQHTTDGKDFTKGYAEDGYSGKFHELGWQSGSANGGSVVETLSESVFGLDHHVENPSPIQFVRYIEQPGLVSKYPVIEDKKFKEDFVPYVKAAMVSFLGIASSAFVALPYELQGAMDYLISKNVVKVQDPYDASATIDKIQFNDEGLAKYLSTINGYGTVNFLAIKGMFKGYDDSMGENGYEKFVNIGEWPKNDHATATKDADMPPLMVATMWPHWSEFTLFNPAASLEENYELNGSTLGADTTTA